MSLVSIDPGISSKNALGWAFFLQKKLSRTGIIRPEKHEDLYAIAQRTWRTISGRWEAFCPDEVAVEWMRLYGPMGKGNSEDLIRLTAVGSLVAGMLRPGKVTYVSVQDWKGNTPEEQTTERVRKALSPDELLIAETSFAADAPRAVGIWHNGYAAIGIGLNRLGRIGR